MTCRQLATAIWIIDKLALRVGNEKSEEEADTVGCCSLRVEHLSFEDPYMLTMDFLAKDSMRYHQVIRVVVAVTVKRSSRSTRAESRSSRT